MDRILADLSARYPNGYSCFTRGGKRLACPLIYQAKTGYSVNVNGSWHFYDRLGVFLRATGGAAPKYLRGPSRPPRPALALRQHSSRGPVAASRLARGIARIEGETRP